MIKLEHTIFAAPFMVSSMLLASNAFPSFWTFLWAGLVLLGARSAAMTFNRIIDRDIDKNNPRTANRAIPAGLISTRKSILFGMGSLVLLCISAYQLPSICWMLSPIAIIGLVTYSYFKRFTWLCHLYLGLVISGAVLGGWAAVTGELSSILPYCLALGICFWIMGFDILYAILDFDFDTKFKIHSIPARFGIKRSIQISQSTHLLSVICVCLGIPYVTSNMQIPYIISIGILCIGLIYEHYLIHKSLDNINKAFFQANAVISSLFGLSIILGKLFQSST